VVSSIAKFRVRQASKIKLVDLSCTSRVVKKLICPLAHRPAIGGKSLTTDRTLK
jgi:hypothetical protein